MEETLSQDEANELIAMKKRFLLHTKLIIPEPFDATLELISENKQERFLLDLRQAHINLKKLRYQNRYAITIPLVRYCSKGVHENPPELGGEMINGPHIHFYREKFWDKFAIPANEFKNPYDIIECLKKFCEICNIEQIKFEQQTSTQRFQ